VLILNLEEDGKADAGTAEALLDGMVVAPGEGRRAWRELKSCVSELAQRREGRSIQGWMEALRREGLHLVADVEKSTAARREAMRLAEVAYRQHLSAQVSSIDLRGVGFMLRLLPASLLAPILVAPTDNHEEDARDGQRSLRIEGAVRRHGRVLLLGLPGSGKSTALRAVAGYWVDRPDWPLPLVVNLKDLVSGLAHQSPLVGIMELATRDLASEDQELMAQGIRERSQEGALAIFLDGLDETRERRVEMVQYIERLLRQVHPDVEVVVSTRDAAYAEATSLGFKELRLLPPKNMTPFIQQVLQELAAAGPVLEAYDRDQWVATRVSWVEQMLRGDPSLREAPLLAILLTLLAGERNLPSVPRNRANILSRVIEHIARRWELIARRGGQYQIGPLSPEDTPRALLNAFEATSFLLIEKPEVKQVEAMETMAAMFQSHWGMPGGRAEAAAEACLKFWDEASIVVATGSIPTLVPRVRLFAEIGAARYVNRCPSAKRLQMLRGLLAEQTSHETVALAAGLSAEIAAEIIGFAVEQESLEWALLAAKAIWEGTEPNEPALRQLVDFLMAHLIQATDRNWEVAQAIARLPVLREQQDQVLTIFEDRLSRPHFILVRALSTVQWGVPSPEFIIEALRAHPGSERSPRGVTARDDQHIVPRLPVISPDEAYNALVEMSAERLLAQYPELAVELVSGAQRASRGTARRVIRMLIELRYDNLIRQERRQYEEPTQSWLKAHESYDRAFEKNFLHLLHTVASLGRPANIPLGKHRRLDELADFIATLQIKSSPATAVHEGLAVLPERLRDLIHATALLGGFEVDVLAAEARSILEEQRRDASLDIELLLYDGGRAVKLRRWDAVMNLRELETRLIDMLADPSLWLASGAATALEHVPNPSELVNDIETRLSELNVRNRDLAARLVCILDHQPERVRVWISHPDCICRRAAAELQADLFTRNLVPASDVERSLLDPDAGVREIVLQGLRGATLNDSLAAHVRTVASDSGALWMCVRCGFQNKGTSHSCAGCNVVSCDPQKAAHALLAQLH
jgi:hypothetical protein